MGMRYLDLARRAFVGQGFDQDPHSPAARVQRLLNELHVEGVVDPSNPYTGPSVERQKENVRSLVAGMTLSGKPPDELAIIQSGYKRLLTDLWRYGDYHTRYYTEDSPQKIHLETTEDLQRTVTTFQEIFLRAADPDIQPQIKGVNTYSGWPADIMNPRRVQILIEWYGLNGHVEDPEEIAADVGIKAPENAHREAMHVFATLFRQDLKDAGVIDYEVKEVNSTRYDRRERTENGSS